MSAARLTIRADFAAYQEQQRRAEDARRQVALRASYEYARGHWHRWSPEWREALSDAMAAGRPIAELLADAAADCPPVEVA
jgi:hypothetical protein